MPQKPPQANPCPPAQAFLGRGSCAGNQWKRAAPGRASLSLGFYLYFIYNRLPVRSLHVR